MRWLFPLLVLAACARPAIHDWVRPSGIWTITKMERIYTDTQGVTWSFSQDSAGFLLLYDVLIREPDRYLGQRVWEWPGYSYKTGIWWEWRDQVLSMGPDAAQAPDRTYTAVLHETTAILTYQGPSDDPAYSTLTETVWLTSISTR